MPWNLFIDDFRSPDWTECLESGVVPKDNWIIAKSSREARVLVEENGMPAKMALDHDLGIDPYSFKVDTVPRFLKWLAHSYWDGKETIPEYTVHSSNPNGKDNIISFMESWKKSATM